jgi:ABC-type multidrug transport system ATPase subunit
VIKIKLDDIGKRFGTNWIFRNVDVTIDRGKRVAITGKNGSGKSTLLQIIAGYIRASEGNLTLENELIIKPEHYYKNLSWAAPYIDLIEDLTAAEFLRFYSQHKPFINDANQNDVLSFCNLNDSADLLLKAFSSGMKQRIKLACAFFARTPLILLDEPLSNIDEDGVRLYIKFIENFSNNRTMIICSNESDKEIFCCSEKIDIMSYKDSAT